MSFRQHLGGVDSFIETWEAFVDRLFFLFVGGESTLQCHFRGSQPSLSLFYPLIIKALFPRVGVDIEGGEVRTLDTSRLYGSKTSYLLIHFLIKCINTHPPYRRCDSESSPANLSNM